MRLPIQIQKLLIDENLVLYMFSLRAEGGKFEIFVGVLLLYTGCIKKKLNKPEIALRLCKAPQCTKFFIEIGCLGTYNVE